MGSILTTLGLSVLVATGQVPAWTLPPEAVWLNRSRHHTCEAEAGSKASLIACAFGGADSDQVDGWAFFRICRSRRETHPFMVFDFSISKLTVWYTETLTLEMELPDEVDILKVFTDVETIRSSCWHPVPEIDL